MLARMMLALSLSVMGCNSLHPLIHPRRSEPVTTPTRLRPLGITAPVTQTTPVIDSTGQFLVQTPPPYEPVPQPAAPIVQTRADVTAVAMTTPTPPAPAAIPTLNQLVELANNQVRKIEGFEARLTRREVVYGKAQPLEVIHFRFRRAPLSIRFKWIGEEGKGREMIYVQGQHGDKLHILTAPGDIPFAKAASRMAFSPDSPLVRGRSRHHIREAGFSGAVGSFTRAVQRGGNSARILGLMQRDEYPAPLLAVEMILAPGDDSVMPEGGKRILYFDVRPDAMTYGLPIVAQTYDLKGQEVEYYTMDRFLHPMKFDDRDFHPDRLGE